MTAKKGGHPGRPLRASENGPGLFSPCGGLALLAFGLLLGFQIFASLLIDDLHRQPHFNAPKSMTLTTVPS